MFCIRRGPCLDHPTTKIWPCVVSLLFLLSVASIASMPIMIPRACPPRMLCKARARLHATEIASAVRQECCSAVGTPSRRHLRTTAAASTAGGNGSRANRQQQQDKGGEEGGRRERSVATVGASPYTLPPPTWSLSDLNVTDDDERGGDTARSAVLSDEEVGGCTVAGHYGAVVLLSYTIHRTATVVMTTVLL